MIYSGIGNKNTDTEAYLMAGINPKFIFQIDTDSLIKNQHEECELCYLRLTQWVDEYFPKYELEDNE